MSRGRVEFEFLTASGVMVTYMVFNSPFEVGMFVCFHVSVHRASDALTMVTFWTEFAGFSNYTTGTQLPKLTPQW
ncbi:hypothetical protein Zmor_023508 [Zophobas morio]|uniref:Uncharacterized protein n=1 Tax=Zophobas morio TaxID=2755281 RepID=A0AA38HY54_9CUCU|nr:hypothetical protein Zmor_023508 [Zophobas morio]